MCFLSSCLAVFGIPSCICNLQIFWKQAPVWRYDLCERRLCLGVSLEIEALGQARGVDIVGHAQVGFPTPSSLVSAVQLRWDVNMIDFGIQLGNWWSALLGGFGGMTVGGVVER